MKMQITSKLAITKKAERDFIFIVKGYKNKEYTC
jgi:hypothetical protein